MKELWELYFSFFKMGAITFGGGLAMLPILQKEVVDNKHWATEEELLNYYAIGQCTPGIIAVNTATFIGYKRKKTLGAILATAGVVTPSLIIIMIIAAFIQNFSHLELVQHAFAGIRVAVAALVTDAVLKLWKSGVKDLFGIITFLIVFILSMIFSLSPVLVVLAAIVAGISASTIQAKRRGINGRD
jgi:chromate transporter